MRPNRSFPFFHKVRRGSLILSAALGLFFEPKTSAAAPLLDLPEGTRITVVGGAWADIFMRDGFLEATFLDAFPEKHLAFRSLAFPGAKVPDTASEAAAMKAALAELDTQCVWAFYGTTEALSDHQEATQFESRLRAFAEQTLSSTSKGHPLRLVLFGPAAQEAAVSTESAVTAHNTALKRASEAVAAVARETGVPFVDLFTESERLFATSQQRAALLPKRWGSSQNALSVHGNLFTPEANRILAPRIFTALTNIPPKNDAPSDARLQLIREKQSEWRRGFQQLPVMPAPEAWRSLEARAFSFDTALQAPRRNDQNRVQEASPQTPAPDSNRTPPFKIAAQSNAQPFASNTEFPDLTPPLQMRWDALGRLWVLCSTGTGTHHKLLVLTDQDGDGRADSCATYAANLCAASDFVLYRDGVLLVEDGDVWLLRDPRGSGAMEQKERLLTGLNIPDASSVQAIALEPSGSVLLYDSHSHRALLETPEGTLRKTNGSVYRLDPLTGQVEIPLEFVSLKEARLQASAKPQATEDGTWIPTEVKTTPWFPPLTQQSVKELLMGLTSPESARLPHVRSALATRPASEVLPALSQWAARLDTTHPASERHRLQALWLSRWFGQTDNGLLEAALRSPNADVRIEAVRVLRDTRVTLAHAARLLEPLSQDADAGVRLEVLLAASGFAPHEAPAVELVHNVATQPMDATCERLAREVLRRLDPDPARMLLPKNHDTRRFVLAGLSNELLVRAPRVEAVWMEQVERDGMQTAALEEGLRGLATLHGSNRATEIAAALSRLQANGLQAEGHFRKLLTMLLSAPAAELRDAERTLEEVASKAQRGALCTQAHAVWLKAAGTPQDLWPRLNGTPDRQLELLKALNLLKDPALSAAFHPVLKRTLSTPNPAPRLLEAAISTLPLTGPPFATENLVLLQAQILNGRAIPEAALALLQLPPEAWERADLQIGALISALSHWHETVPQSKQQDIAKKAALEAIKRLEARQKTMTDCTD